MELLSVESPYDDPTGTTMKSKVLKMTVQTAMLVGKTLKHRAAKV